MALTHVADAITAGSNFDGSADAGQIADPGSGDWQCHQISLDLGSDTKTSWLIKAVYASTKEHTLLQGGSGAGDYPLNSQYVFWRPDQPILMATGDEIQVVTAGAGQAMSMEAKTEAYT